MSGGVDSEESDWDQSSMDGEDGYGSESDLSLGAATATALNGDSTTFVSKGSYSNGIHRKSRVSMTPGVAFDLFLHKVRVLFALSIATPISLLTMHSGGFTQFRAVQKINVRNGEASARKFQDRFRSKFLDVYFGVFTFFAEQDFFLVVIPIFYWNTDYLLGHRFSAMVMNGLLIGNVLKDIFELPRPSSKVVWRPEHQSSIDSAGLEDYGWPSTHAMNGVTNAVMFFLHYQEKGVIDSPAKAALGVSLVTYYIASLSISRLYLGAHTLTDLFGGWALGATLVSSYWLMRNVIDDYVLTTSWLPLKGALLVGTALLLNPQPRPLKPTLAINALVAGTILGENIGFRLYNEQNLQSFNVVLDRESSMLQVFRDSPLTNNNELFLSIQSSILVQIHSYMQGLSDAMPMRLLLLVRLIVGIIILAIIRVVVKELAGIALSLIGVPVKPPASPSKTESRPKPKRSTSFRNVVRLFTKDKHIVGSVIQRTCTYAAVALGITYGVPGVFLLLGLNLQE